MDCGEGENTDSKPQGMGGIKLNQVRFEFGSSQLSTCKMGFTKLKAHLIELGTIGSRLAPLYAHSGGQHALSHAL